MTPTSRQPRRSSSNNSHLRTHFERAQGRKAQIETESVRITESLRDNKRKLVRHEQAREIIREVGLATQQQLEVHISDITSLALESVFDDPYELDVEFVQRRNKTECDLLFVRGNDRMNPLDSSGYGAVDVASLALRIASWSMEMPRKRNTIILDEPMRFLSEDKQERASQMIKELSDRLGIQFIIVTHNATLAGYADKVFRVTKRKDKPSVVSTR